MSERTSMARLSNSNVQNSDIRQYRLHENGSRRPIPIDAHGETIPIVTTESALNEMSRLDTIRRREALFRSPSQDGTTSEDRNATLHHDSGGDAGPSQSQQAPPTDATPEIPSYMTRDALVHELVTNESFSDEQYNYFKGAAERELSEQQAGALYNLCSKHIRLSLIHI
mgnify:CR=1 FL=1